MMRLALMLGLASLAGLTVSGCMDTRGGAIAYGVKGFGAPDAPKPMISNANYKIAPLDTLAVKVYKFDDLSGDYDVDLTGDITMPLIGAVAAIDMTPQQLSEKLAAKLGEKYLQSPNVSVAVKSSTSRNVTVDGAVSQPGNYAVMGPTTLVQAIAMAHGTSEDANQRRVAIFRQIDGRRMAAAFDLKNIRQGKAEDPPVYSGDIIIVDGSSIKGIYKKTLSAIPLLALFGPL